MADTLPSPNEKTIVANNSHVGRLWALTIASLALNALILVLLVGGAIIHHHHRHHGFAGRDGGGGCFEGRGEFGSGHPFHHFRDSGWGPQGGFENEGGPGFDGTDRGERGPSGHPHGMPGMGGTQGMMGRPDPARMTDVILNHLSEKLALTDDEKAKIKPIVEQQVTQIQKDMEAQRAAMLKSMEDTRAKIKPLLTADQQKQLDAMPLPGQKPPPPDETKQPTPKPGQ